MSVQIIAGQQALSALTSPPPKPEPKPASAIVAKVVEYVDRQIIVTKPFPDTIELITDVFNHHLVTPYEAGGSVKKVFLQIDQDMKEWVEGYKSGQTVFSPAPHVSGSPNKRKVTYRIGYDAQQPLKVATVTLSRRQGPDYGIWSIKLEFSASKAGAAGLAQLTSRIEDAVPFQMAALLGSFRISRIDPAIDLIGARPIDLICHVPKPGKRLVYVGNNGRAESLYLYEAKPPLKKPPASITYKTQGPLRLKIYERRDYFLQLALSPPYGPSPVTRAELEMRWKKQRPLLATLSDLPNLFAGRRIAYAAAALPGLSIGQQDDWVRFCLASMGGGSSAAQLHWKVAVGLRFRKAYAECHGDLVGETAWSGWKDGIQSTGLDHWVFLANSAQKTGHDAP